MFTDRLRLALTLVAGSDPLTFPSGSIERLDVALTIYGFEADVTFRVSSEQQADPMFEAFAGSGLIKATLTLATCVLDGTGEEPEPARIVGYVIERSLREEVSDRAQGAPIVGRVYRIVFRDPAAAFWREHRPIELFAGASMQDVIEAYKTQGMELTFDWARLSEKLDVLCIAASTEHAASFYDVLIWYIACNGGFIELDAAESRYRIAGEKLRPTKPTPLEKEAVEQLMLLRPATARNGVRVLNADASTPQRVDVPNKQALLGVRRDALERTPIASQFDERRALEAAALRAPEHEMRVTFGRCPPRLSAPGAFLSLANDWSERLYAAKKAYRVVELRLSAGPVANDEATELTDATAPFAIALSMRLELASSPRPQLPPFVAPSYPVLVEGRVVSEGGGDDDRTWMIAEDERTSILRYWLDVPLWNKKIVAAFEPGHAPGHLFFPAYKGQRALLALQFGRASVLRFLDWAANARTPAEAQGNRIVLGAGASNGALIEHAYAGGQPALRIARTFGNDLQTLEVKEGVIYLEVKEDEST